MLIPLAFFLTISMPPFNGLSEEKQRPSLEEKIGFRQNLLIRGKKARYGINSEGEFLSIYGKNSFDIYNNDRDLDVDSILINTIDGVLIKKAIIISPTTINYDEKLFPDQEILKKFVESANAYLQEARKIVEKESESYSLSITKNPLE